MEIEEVIDILEPLIKNPKTKGYWKEKWWANEERIQALTSAIEILQRVEKKGIEEILSALQLTWDVQMYNHTTKKRWTEHAKVELKGKDFAGRLSIAITKYLEGEK